MDDYPKSHLTWRRIAAVFVAVALSAAACGSGSAASDNSSVVAGEPDEVPPTSAPATVQEPAPTPVPATVESETSADTGNPADAEQPAEGETANEHALPIPDAPAVESIYQTDPEPAGWPIAAGQWISHSFDPPLAFTLPVDGTVISDGADAIEIAIGDPGDPEGFIVISTPIAVSRPAGPVPIRLVEPEKVLLGVDVSFEAVGQGALGEYTVRDITMQSTPPFDEFLKTCYRSPELQCLDPFVTRSGFVLLETDVVHTFVAQDWGDRGRLYVAGTATGAVGEVDFRALATDIALSVVPAAGSTHDGTRWLSTLGTRSDEIPAGTYLARVGRTNLHLQYAATVPMVELPIITQDVLGFEDVDGAGWVWFLDFGDFLDEQTEKARTDRTIDGPLPTETFEQDLRETLIVGDTGRGTVGGVEATWFMVSADPDDEKALPCGANGWQTRDALCQTWTTTTSHYWYSPSNVESRLYYLEDQDLLVSATPFPGHTIDELLSRFGPLLDGLTIQPSGAE